MDGDEAGPREQFVQPEPPASQGGDVSFGNVRIVNQKGHLEGPRPYRHPGAYVSHADDADGFIRQLRSQEFEVVSPAVFFYRPVCLDGMADQGDHLSEDQLGDRNRIAAGHVRDPHFMFLGRVEIDSRWVYTDSGTRYDLEPASTPLHVLSGNLAFSADDGIHLRGFSFPAFRFDPRIHNHDLRP